MRRREVGRAPGGRCGAPWGGRTSWAWRGARA